MNNEENCYVKIVLVLNSDFKISWQNVNYILK